MSALRHRFPVAAFDLDGTLIDTAPDLTAALNHALALAERPPVPPEEVRHMVGDGVVKLLERGLAASGPPVDGEIFDRLRQAFLAHYKAHLADLSRPFIGVPETLAALKGEGIALAVCTNKPSGFTEPLLKALGLRGFFASVVSGDDLPWRKPDGRHLKAAFERAGGEARRGVLVGDAHNDVAAARDAGVPVVLVSYGYTATPAARLQGDAVIDDFRALPRTLAGLAPRRS
ncbi:MAG: phosphoglycolate phosphatase [Alphaproteobacteria bacterium]|nr:phosphoglycolate phosphatase [Alphaproteobacteria bacterium]